MEVFTFFCQYGEERRDFWTSKNDQKRPQAPKPIVWDLESEKSGNQVPVFDFFETYLISAP